jgi:hypothetical protein
MTWRHVEPMWLARGQEVLVAGASPRPTRYE